MKREIFAHVQRISSSFYAAFLLLSSISFTTNAQQSRGIGKYPGHPAEYFGPNIKQDTSYRNLALHRAVYQSGAYDYNLTAQLLTDGIVSAEAPAYLDVLVNGKPLPANERKLTINDSEWSRVPVMGSHATLEYIWNNMQIETDEIVIEGFVAYDPTKPFHGFDMKCEVMENGGSRTFSHHTDNLPGLPRKRKVVNDPNKQTEEPTAMARNLKETYSLRGVRSLHRLKFTFDQSNSLYWSIKEVTFFRKGKAVRHLFPAQRFCSVWKAQRGAWAYVDLGNVADISDIKLHWNGQTVPFSLEFSQDASSWHTVDCSAPHNVQDGNVQIISTSTRARFVRVTLDQDACLSEIEVFGKNGMKATPCHEQGWAGDKFMLNGGNWTIRPIDSPLPSKAREMGPEIVATVPATVLSSYYNAGALPNPNFDDNLSMISESFFNRDYLYKRTFSLPSEMNGKRVMLNFDGINWKAHIVLNGKIVGHIHGAFTRGQFDVTDYLQPQNTLLVYIERNAHPGARKIKTSENTSFNGGVLGSDNPTFHATIGWDWITTIPGRDLGIWNDVYLTATDAVSLCDPLVFSILEQGRASMTPSVFLRNHLSSHVHGTLMGHIGDIHFEKQVSLSPNAETEVSFSPKEFPQLSHRLMKLWWPNGYGEPNMYTAGFSFHSTDSAHASITYQTGIRQVTYSHEMSRLQLYINGQRFIPLGGNWGFSESHLNYRGREYDIAVDYHRQMNCNIIRNWVGQTGDEEFYQSCDRNGIMVWQDFWLANPADGPNPADESMFMNNARDYVRRIRQHPCIALYCGRNEGYPPASLNQQLTSMVHQLVPGALYIPSSADDGVSGHGPYRALPTKDYFLNQTGKLHSERGMPNVTNFESLCRMLATEHLWPQNEYWGKHDFTQKGAQYGLSFNELLHARFGNELPVQSMQNPAQTYTSLAQWQNYEGYRAMYESSNLQRQGLIIWMSHSCWPSMTWQTYDYYFEPTAAFFGVKKACEPVHVQYNAATNSVDMVNMMKPMQSVSVRATIYDLHGHSLWSKQMDVSIPTDSTIECFDIDCEEADDKTTMLRLEAVSQHDNSLLSSNTYFLWGSHTQTDLWQIPQTSLDISPAMTGDPNEVVITNTGDAPALMIRLNLCATDCQQILPVEYTDNYFHLLPGERHSVRVSWNPNDARGKQPILHISAFNSTGNEFHGLGLP